MIKVYTGKLLKDIPYLEAFFPNWGTIERPNVFGENIFNNFTKPVVEIVENAASADYLCIPYNYNYVKRNEAYIQEFITLSKSHNKKILVFVIGDSDEDVLLPNCIVFRHSQYRYKKKENEIMLPAYAVDLGSLYGLQKRDKQQKATVTFCGWADLGSVRERLGFYARLTKITCAKLLGDKWAYVHTRGLYFRRKAISILQKNTEIATDFVIRKSYSGHSKTIATDPQETRKEYVENMKRGDFVLAPKGDGNFSVRFFEALSLGRVPLLIDTECVLPLEHVIDYDSFILRVDYRKINELPAIVRDFYAQLSQESYREMQEHARKAFEQYLKIDSFYGYVFSKDVIESLVTKR